MSPKGFTKEEDGVDMSVELVTSCLFMDVGSEPNFEAARNYIEKLTPNELYESLSDQYPQYCDLYFDEELDDESAKEFIEKAAKGVRDNLLSSLKEIELGWKNGHCMFNKFTVENTVILLTGGESCGDGIETIDSMNRFELCGAAKVAGFREV